MAKSLDKVLQPDGTYKWELVEPFNLKRWVMVLKLSVLLQPKETKKKVSKKKTTSPLSD